MDEEQTSVTERGLGSKVIPGHIIVNDKKELAANAHWYVVHTYSGHEARVAETLRQRVATLGQTDKVFELLIPTQDKIHIKHGKKSSVREKIFPGYLLVKMVVDDDSWLVVRTTQGITGFVGVGNKPTPLSDTEVTAIMQFAQMGAPKYKANFSLGEAVKITDGPFADFLGSIESIDESAGKLRVLVSIFGRETPVELDFLQVKKI
ncbi:MAG: Transcription antitermination protein nusG [Candidatus Amesbacteria bacterium GW2011_GWB1_47_19]|nr:MAG: Transcription antitermination protein nusG [Candidatus Amesbacteria bacterium GW2011_GWA1_44_24]KKU31498.1 MAG: Transcription antitermination protein nusG [Candidatus Amesbacteria bacterium GW2011_GWC1_46_24]KKU67506.1 MAG: Transcription antitermination protein nusG [Candidatus Amesbacteria bacterium GW2011_GWB1_47_19]HBC72518.1 transcription termination/antitermination protein NusG [Candidatus Amesbacteria bacterium]